jgi:hypothetical protein
MHNIFFADVTYCQWRQNGLRFLRTAHCVAEGTVTGVLIAPTDVVQVSRRFDNQSVGAFLGANALT